MPANEEIEADGDEKDAGDCPDDEEKSRKEGGSAVGPLA